jgi:hypothetical protein
MGGRCISLQPFSIFLFFLKSACPKTNFEFASFPYRTRGKQDDSLTGCFAKRMLSSRHPQETSPRWQIRWSLKEAVHSRRLKEQGTTPISVHTTLTSFAPCPPPLCFRQAPVCTLHGSSLKAASCKDHPQFTFHFSLFTIHWQWWVGG